MEESHVSSVAGFPGLSASGEPVPIYAEDCVSLESSKGSEWISSSSSSVSSRSRLSTGFFHRLLHKGQPSSPSLEDQIRIKQVSSTDLVQPYTPPSMLHFSPSPNRKKTMHTHPQPPLRMFSGSKSASTEALLLFPSFLLS